MKSYAMLTNDLPKTGAIYIMSDLTILAASVKTTLLEIARHASALGTGLQNAAPGERTGAPNNSVQYLITISETLTKYAEECERNFIANQQN